jgi:tyrosine-protein phosphatase SIW14
MQGWSLTGIFAEGDMFAGSAGGAEGGGVGEAGREVCSVFIHIISLNA